MDQNNETKTNETNRTQQFVILLLLAGVVLAFVSLFLRIFTAGEHEIKTVDLIIIVIPLLLVALATGKLKSLDLFGVKVDFADLWAEVGRTKIIDDVSDETVLDAVDVLPTAAKGSLQELRQLIGSKIEALEFTLGHGTYSGEAVEKYFDALSDSLRVVVVNDPEGKLFAIHNAPDLINSLRLSEENGFEQFAQQLNSGSQEDRRKLSKLPGFVDDEKMVTDSTTKREALAKMEKLNTDFLPVVDKDRRFMGTIDRSKLTAGLILAVTDKLEDR